MEDSKDGQAKETVKPHKMVETEKIPVIKEKLSISSRENITGEVEVRKVVKTEEIDVPLTTIRTRYREERVPVNRTVDTAPQVRYEGENLVIPIIREEEVVIKRLILVEEIHLIRERTTEERTEHIQLRSEEATVTRKPADPDQPKE
ncbi:DUF2382 domain-containing protein [Lewinella sp. IMCC34183]|uniref:DUF2382 domain-containing protein n=1 Tax=Lewinella sp. IMCC34183 TaxID=2248762 RepID=UPI000E257403|nr:DUF2382 domain-containing protein [Lewinella sp. IMCC34183]